MKIKKNDYMSGTAFSSKHDRNIYKTVLIVLYKASVKVFAVGYLKVFQLTVLSRSAIAVLSNFFVVLFVLSICTFDISVGVGAFVIGLGQISSFVDYLPKTACLQFDFNNDQVRSA